MIVLAFDTAAEACSAALWRDGEILASRRETLGRGHAERLYPMLEAVLTEAGHTWSDLDRIGVVAGPGTFTGLRVGVAAARGLALALDRPAIGLDAFEAIAAGLALERDARRLAVCVGKPPRLQWRLFELKAGRATALSEIRAGDAEALAADGPDLLAGPALPVLEERAELRAATGENAVAADPALLARMTAEATPGDEPPRPRYAREADAAPARPPAPRLSDRASDASGSA